MRLAVLLPCLNEERAIPAVLDELAAWTAAHDHAVEVVLCDNGSTDRGPDLAAARGATVVHQPARGYGGALLTGLAHLRADPPDVVLVLDADRSVDLADLDPLLAPLLAGDADLVMGERVTRGDPATMTPPQRFGNALAVRLIAARTGHRYLDMGPFRALTWAAFERLGMEDRTWGWNVEMQMKAARMGLRVRELPVATRPRVGVSKISGTVSGVARAGAKILYACWRYA